METYLVPWLVLSFIVGLFGNNRRIGFGWSFIISIFLSPIIGFIAVFSSESNESFFAKQKAIKIQQEQQKQNQEIMTKIQAAPVSQNSLADELEKLSKLKEQSLISEEDFNRAKAKLLS